MTASTQIRVLLVIPAGQYETSQVTFLKWLREKKGKEKKEKWPSQVLPWSLCRNWKIMRLKRTHYTLYKHTHTPVKTRITRTSGSLTSLQHKSENTMLTNKTKKRKWKDTIQWTITTPPNTHISALLSFNLWRLFLSGAQMKMTYVGVLRPAARRT